VPTSDPNNIHPLLAILTGLQPRRVLDIGCGFGKYGVLLREYVDVWNDRLHPDQWQLELVGIEAFAGYRNPIHDYVYTKVHYAEASQILPQLGPFDVILMADVIEHLDQSQAVNLVAQCLNQSPVLVISTPVAFYAQQAHQGNTYEVHRSLFSHADFPSNVCVRWLPMISCNIFVASRQPLANAVFTLADPADLVYLRSRRKLGNWGWPLSAGLRLLCKLLS